MSCFWSFALFDVDTTTMYANPFKRNSIGDHTEGIKFDDDDSLTLTIVHSEPEDKSN